MNSDLDCNCTLVDILLSVDAGLSFDNLLDVVVKSPIRCGSVYVCAWMGVADHGIFLGPSLYEIVSFVSIHKLGQALYKRFLC